MLTDEQRITLRSRYHAGRATLDDLWDEVYRLGMLRAAEVKCPLPHEGTQMYANFLAGVATLRAAIRAEAGETSEKGG